MADYIQSPPIYNMDSLIECHRENDALMAQIASLEARIPSPEELAYLNNRKFNLSKGTK